jgi:hypothetical protein
MLTENRIQISGISHTQMRLHVSMSKRDLIRKKFRNDKIIKNKINIL